MKIIFTSKGEAWDSKIDPRFGRTDFFVIYDEETDALSSQNNQSASAEAHGAGPQTASNIVKLNPNVIITGNGPGGNAETVLKKMNVEIYTGAGDMTVKEAYEAYKSNKLPKFM